MDSRTQVCRCYDLTNMPPQGEHFESCPFYVTPIAPVSAPEYFQITPPDYTAVLERIACALEAIWERLGA